MQLTKTDLKMIQAVASATGAKRKARTISLDDEQYEKFQKYCQEQGLAANKVLDVLVGLFLESVEP
jgi:hypothetical protein